MAISFTQCISADDEYKRKGWEIDTEVDDLTDEITSYRVRLEYSKLRSVVFHILAGDIKKIWRETFWFLSNTRVEKLT